MQVKIEKRIEKNTLGMDVEIFYVKANHETLGEFRRQEMAEAFAGWLRTKEEREDRIGWLRETLIPDLKESGYEMTAESFEMCIRLMEFKGHGS